MQSHEKHISHLEKKLNEVLISQQNEFSLAENKENQPPMQKLSQDGTTHECVYDVERKKAGEVRNFGSELKVTRKSMTSSEADPASSDSDSHCYFYVTSDSTVSSEDEENKVNNVTLEAPVNPESQQTKVDSNQKQSEISSQDENTLRDESSKLTTSASQSEQTSLATQTELPLSLEVSTGTDRSDVTSTETSMTPIRTCESCVNTDRLAAS